MPHKLYKLSKLWSVQETAIRNRCQQLRYAIENEKSHIITLQKFHRDYLINIDSLNGLALKENSRFCNNLGELTLTQEKNINKLEEELKGLQKLHSRYIQKISNLDKIITKRESIQNSYKLKQECKEVEELYRQFKQFGE